MAFSIWLLPSPLLAAQLGGGFSTGGSGQGHEAFSPTSSHIWVGEAGQRISKLLHLQAEEAKFCRIMAESMVVLSYTQSSPIRWRLYSRWSRSRILGPNLPCSSSLLGTGSIPGEVSPEHQRLPPCTASRVETQRFYPGRKTVHKRRELQLATKKLIYFFETVWRYSSLWSFWKQ